MSEKPLATIWRHDGVIHFTLPPIMAVHTFLALAAQRGPWLCFFVEDLAATLVAEDATEEMRTKFHVDVLTLAKGVLKQHESVIGESRIKRGTDDFLPGMLYGTMHPAELAALADEVSTVIAMYAIGAKSEAGKALAHDLGLWVEGAKKYTRPIEQVASMAEPENE